MEYTKGEWKLVQPASRQIEVLGYTGMIATLRLNSLMTPQEMQANAQLIASAPDLYEALIELVAWYKARGFDRELPEYRNAEKALTKAEGGK